VSVITCFIDFLDFLALGGRLRRLLLALEDIAVVDGALLLMLCTLIAASG
jgi:hypothetical protein